MCDDSVLTSSGSMCACALNRIKQQSMNHVVMHMVKIKMNSACLTTEPVNVHTTMLALVFAIASVDLPKEYSLIRAACTLLGVEEMY